MSINSTVAQVTTQAFGGMVIGSIVDKYFPSSGQPGLLTGLEIVGQLTVDAIFTASYWEFVRRRGLPAIGNDPTQGAAFLIPFISFQSKLRSKMMAFQAYLDTLLGNIHLSDYNSGSSRMPTVSAPNSMASSSPTSLPGYRDESQGMEQPKDLNQGNAPTDFSSIFAAGEDMEGTMDQGNFAMSQM